MKWVLWIIGAVVVAALVGGFLFKDVIGFLLFRASVKPPAAFVDTVAPAAPDYANPDQWAALPDRADAADFTPEGVSDGQASAAVDVFFIHPTTYIDKAGWNAPMGEAASSKFVDDYVMTGQASAFNGSARVYAPRYRQAQIYAFMAREDGGNDALELAYSDIEAAFDHYLANDNGGRPFIIAGHSQGALHSRWLLERKISGSPLKGLLVAAYPVGFGIKRADIASTMPDIPVCGAGDEIGCMVTWNTVGDGYRGFEPTEDYVCVNPLTWTANGAQGDFEANSGAISTATRKLAPGAADGTCRDGLLYLSDIRTDAFDNLPINMGKGNHHLLDYALYWSNVRSNVADRVDEYLAAQPTTLSE